MKIKLIVLSALIVIMPFTLSAGNKLKNMSVRGTYFSYEGKLKNKQPYGQGVFYVGTGVHASISGVWNNGSVSNATVSFRNGYMTYTGDLQFEYRDISSTEGFVSYTFTKGVLTAGGETVNISRPYTVEVNGNELGNYTRNYVYSEIWVQQDGPMNRTDRFIFMTYPRVYYKEVKKLEGFQFNVYKDSKIKVRDNGGRESFVDIINENRIVFSNNDYVDPEQKTFKKTLDSCIVTYKDRNPDYTSYQVSFVEEMENYIMKQYNMTHDMFMYLEYDAHDKSFGYSRNTQGSGSIYSINYTNGDRFVGCVNDAKSFDEIYSINTTPKESDYWFGKLTKKDGTVKYYIYGRDADECVNESNELYALDQMAKAKKLAKDEEDRQKAAKAEYEAECKKYGEKWVITARNHHFDVGMPEELFLKYFSEPWTADQGSGVVKFTLRQMGKSETTTTYWLYVQALALGYDMQTAQDYVIIYFTNGKLSRYVK